ncbi:putative receptor-like protein kinase At5g24010 [Wolffia australiana]
MAAMARWLWRSAVVVVALLFFDASAYSPGTDFLLNCGGSDTVSGAMDDGRTFVPDGTSLSSAFSLSTRHEISLLDPSPSSSLPDLYRSSRIFTSPSSYLFPISRPAPIFLRLHFRPFRAPEFDLASSIFNVSASGSPLLIDFRPPSSSITVEEFVFWFDLPRLELNFVPDVGSNGGLAFVSAIEVFSAPAAIIPNSAIEISASGARTSSAVSAQVLRKCHRVNVGGALLSAGNDTLWRRWLPDLGGGESYLVSPANQSQTVVFPGLVSYQDGGPTQEIAPNAVYGTARKLRIGGDGELHNLSWSFSVPARRRFLLRLHFCDVVSAALYTLYFNVFVDGVLAMGDVDLSSLAAGPVLHSPYYADFLVDAGRSGVLQVMVGPSDWSPPSLANAILNGVEVMEMIGAAEFSTIPEAQRGKLLFGLILGSLLVFSLLIAIVALVILRRWKQIGKGKQPASMISRPLPLNLNLGLRIPLSEIAAATGNFSSLNQIGFGGFGRVYEGALRDGTRVAVKRADPGSAGQGLTEFITEVQVLSRLRHRHLVSLIGYSTDQAELILVYEFMDQGSLRDHLYGTGKAPLPWKRRLEICIGAAKGLHYLHTGSDQVFIHRDVKSSNILLAAGGIAKVGDFGLCKMAPLAGASQVVTGVKGSFGYLDPDYLKTQQLTCKSDVYSFGVVMLEVLCGRPAIDPSVPSEMVNLAEWASRRHQEGLLEDIVDPAIRGSLASQSLVEFMNTAAACLAVCGADRPAIADVLRSLENALRLQLSHCPCDEDKRAQEGGELGSTS